jgi:hypothetical protein
VGPTRQRVRERERGEGEVSRMDANGPREKWAACWKKKKKRWRDGLLGWMVGMGEGLVLFFSFSFFFKSFFKPIFSTLLNSNLFHKFLQLFLNYFKDFSKTFLNNFSNIFKFKLLHKFSQTFS